MISPAEARLRYRLDEGPFHRVMVGVCIALAGAFVGLNVAFDELDSGNLAASLVAPLAVLLVYAVAIRFTNYVTLDAEKIQIRQYRTAQEISYAGVELVNFRNGEIRIRYRVALWDGSLTSYSLQAAFRPQDPERVVEEIQRRVEEAKRKAEA